LNLEIVIKSIPEVESDKYNTEYSKSKIFVLHF